MPIWSMGFQRESEVALGYGGFGGSLEAPPNGDRTARRSLVQQRLDALDAPLSSY